MKASKVRSGLAYVSPIRGALILAIALVGAIGSWVLAHEGAPPQEPAAFPSLPSPTIPQYLAGSSQGKAAKDRPPLPELFKLKPEDYPKGTDPTEALDEPMSGRTRLGTPVSKRTPDCFPAEPRDLFWQMDQVASGPNGELQPLDFDLDRDGKISNLPPHAKRNTSRDSERDAIRGRNTWVLWGAGNDVFWNWLQQEGYGTHDFLILLDSRKREGRFREAGFINQPGFKAVQNPSEKILGLYLDLPKSNGSTLLLPPPNPQAQGGYDQTEMDAAAKYTGSMREGWDAQGRKLDASIARPVPPQQHAPALPLFKGWEPASREKDPKRAMQDAMLRNYLVDSVRSKLPQDGVDTDIYGYPSGIVGLRLFLNPDFFGDTDAAHQARLYWKQQVEDNHDRLYFGSFRLFRPKPREAVSDQHVVRLLPHLDASPESAGKSGRAAVGQPSNNIGNQYWRPQKAFGTLLPRNTFVHHFLGSQQPGTIDTSQVATDQINNSNTINAVFDVPARLGWARNLPPETQSKSNLLLPSVRFGEAAENPRFAPRVLLDGSDSIGAFGALARVYLNIGTSFEQWERTNNIFIGFTKQRPFSVDTCQKNSVYWQTNERYRAGYLRDFFTAKQDPPKDPTAAPSPPSGAGVTPFDPNHRAQNSTEPMKLRNAVDSETKKPGQWFADVDYGGVKIKGHSKEERLAGRGIWLRNCAICHSSKQPSGFALNFSRDWKNAPVSKPEDGAVVTLPMDFADWEEFRGSLAMKQYRERLLAVVDGEAEAAKFDRNTDPAEQDHPFWKDNYLSTDIRVPITLVGTNASRALGTNGVAENMWADFSSDTYKGLSGVGSIRYYNPYANPAPDWFGNNAEFPAPGGGVGYYRPASHISLWATAPFFHNNALGLFNNDPSVPGRLAAFDDAIRKLLTQDDRAKHSRPGTGGVPFGAIRIGDLRPESSRAVLQFPGDDSQKGDPGLIYRIPRETHVQIGPSFIWPLIVGVAGSSVAKILSYWLWVFLVILWVILGWWAKARHAGFVLLALAAVIAVFLLLTGVGGTGIGGMVVPVLLMALSNVLEISHKGWWLLAIALGLVGWWLLHLKAQQGRRGPKNIIIAVLLVGVALWIASMVFGSGVVAGYLLGIVAWIRGAGMWGVLLVGIMTLVIAYVVFQRFGGDGIARLMHTALAIGAMLIGFVANHFINGRLVSHGQLVGVDVGPIPRGMPVNYLMSMDPHSPNMVRAVVSMFYGITRIKKDHLEGDDAWLAFSEEAGAALVAASKCPDHVLDRGHWFGEKLSAEEKEQLIAFLKTL